MSGCLSLRLRPLPRWHLTDLCCHRKLEVPFPTDRLANIAQRSIAVDKELSPLVRRTFTVSSQPRTETQTEIAILHVHYEATTNRMLRVAVNSFLDSLNLVVEVMEQLDEDVLEQEEE